jgi:hypothetical protein
MPIFGLQGVADETIFDGLNGVMLGWILLMLAPSWKHTQTVVLFIVAFYSAVYVATLAGAVQQGVPKGSGFMSLEEVFTLFSDKSAVLAGWTHYIAFDLFVARYIIADSQAAGIPHLLVVWTVPLTLMAGPTGLLLYLMTKGVYTAVVPAPKAKGQ